MQGKGVEFSKRAGRRKKIELSFSFQRMCSQKHQKGHRVAGLVLTIELSPQHWRLLHSIHRDFYTGDMFVGGILRLWEGVDGETDQHYKIKLTCSGSIWTLHS